MFLLTMKNTPQTQRGIFYLAGEGDSNHHAEASDDGAFDS
jgi:hypothetical protein